MRCPRLFQLALLAVMMVFAACGAYTGRLEGDKVRIEATTSPFSFKASGENMTGSILKGDAVLAALPTKITGTVSWTKATGWQITETAAPSAYRATSNPGPDYMVEREPLTDLYRVVLLNRAPSGGAAPAPEPVGPSVYASP